MTLFNAETTYTAGAQTVITAMLQSPSFLYRTELGTGSGNNFTLTPYEVANNLSYLLTGTMPDDTLMAAAAQVAAGTLTTAAMLDQQATRLAIRRVEQMTVPVLLRSLVRWTWRSSVRWRARGRAIIRSGEDAAAAIELYLFHAGASNLRGTLHAIRGEIDAAKADFAEAVAADPDDPASLFNLAQAYQQLGRAGDAAALYRRVLARTRARPRRRGLPHWTRRLRLCFRDEPKRRAVRARAAHVPAGVNSPVRAFRSVGGTPLFMARGEGPYVWDVDGKRYIDYVGSWGPAIAGPRATGSRARRAARAVAGLAFGAPTELEIEMAELLVRRSALDGARASRDVRAPRPRCAPSALREVSRADSKIVKFEGCYHGHGDSLLVKAGSGALTFGQPVSAGVPPEIAANTLSRDFNDPEASSGVSAQAPMQIAGVIVEPVAGNMNLVKPAPDS